jgi:protein arginine kinase activator
MEERPIECTSCKRKATITYKEMAEGKTQSMKVCSECPILRKKLGSPSNDTIATNYEETLSTLCSHCHTSFQSLLMGQPLGCPKCYSSFEDILVQELIETNAIPVQSGSNLTQKEMPLHLGGSPEHKEIDLGISIKLESLNIALTEALALEHYERAANLRDQIKTIMDHSNGNT